MGPRKIIDLDSVPERDWVVEPNALHLYQGKAWTYAAVGCILCTQFGRIDPKGQTLQLDDSNHPISVCLTHGRLVVVPVFIDIKTTVSAGDIVTTKSKTIEDQFLLPLKMPDDERTELLKQYTDILATMPEVEE